MDVANRELNKNIVGFDKRVTEIFQNYDWPGNLRQMKNTVMRATLLSQGDYIQFDVLPREMLDGNRTEERSTLLRDPNDERARIVNALRSCGGNKSMAAKMLGVDRKTLYNKLKALNIEQ